MLKTSCSVPNTRSRCWDKKRAKASPSGNTFWPGTDHPSSMLMNICQIQWKMLGRKRMQGKSMGEVAEPMSRKVKQDHPIENLHVITGQKWRNLLSQTSFNKYEKTLSEGRHSMAGTRARKEKSVYKLTLLAFYFTASSHTLLLQELRKIVTFFISALSQEAKSSFSFFFFCLVLIF